MLGPSISALTSVLASVLASGAVAPDATDEPEYEIDEIEEVAAPQIEPEASGGAEPSASGQGAETEAPALAAEVVEPPVEASETATTTTAAAEAADAPVDTVPVEDVPAEDIAAPTPSAPKAAADKAAPARRRSVAKSARAVADHLRVGGFVQVDFLRRQISEDQLSDGDATPLNETGFHLRNARLGLDADWRYFGVTAFGEFFSNGESVRPATVDAHAQLPGKDGSPPLLQLRAGLLRVPFGFENYNQNDVQRFFGERTLAMHAYVPGLFDVGASVGGHVWAIDWIVGVYNGQPVGAPGFGFRDPNAAKDFAGRLQIGGALTSWFDATLGFSFLSGKGFSAGTPPTKDSFDWVDLNQDGRVTVAELIPIAGSAGRASENFRRWALGGDVQLRAAIPKIGPLVVYGEIAAGSNLDRAVAVADPVLLGRDQRGLGWYVGLTQSLTRHAAIGLRYDQYLPNLDTLESYGGITVNTRSRFQTITGGVSGYLHQGERARARLLVEYEHQRNTLGRDAQGRPDQLANDTVRVRAEVVF